MIQQRKEIKTLNGVIKDILINASSLKEQIKMREQIEADQVRECVSQMDLKAAAAAPRSQEQFFRDVTLGNRKAVLSTLERGDVDLLAVDSEGRTVLTIAYGMMSRDRGLIWNILNEYRLKQIHEFEKIEAAVPNGQPLAGMTISPMI